MIKNRLVIFREYRIKFKYEILLVSFIILIFGDVFFDERIDAGSYLIIQNVLASIVLFYGKRRWRVPLFIMLILISGLVVLNLIFAFSNIRLIFAITYIIYFAFLSTEVFSQIFKTKDVTASVVSAVLCGFIIIGLVGGYVFSIIEIIHAGSFNNIAEGIGRFEDLTYFSFITVLSVGYGDITPATDVAQKAAMFFGLIGYFYGVVVIGIIIGKFISKR